MADVTVHREATARPHAAPTGWRIGLFFASWAFVFLGPVAAVGHEATPGGWWTYLALYGLVLVAISRLLAGFRDDAHPGKWHRLLVARPLWYVQLGLPFVTLPTILGWLVGLPFGRGLAWAQVTLGVMAMLVGGGFFFGWIGSKLLVVKKLTFSWPDLPAAFDGIRIVQLSDMHVGPQTSDRYLRRVVRVVEAAKADLIVHTGDQVDDHHEDTPRFGAFFGKVRAPLGVFAIPGNHDVYAGWPEVKAGLEAADIRVLVNEAIRIERAGEELWLAGTGDPAALGSFGRPAPEAAPDIERTLSEIPVDAFSLVLAHNPALWPVLASRNVHLTLSGHTHHGQLSIPALGWSLASPFLKLAMGTYARGRARLYISPGTNHWGLPFRLGAWPEVTLLTLRRGPS